MLLFSFSIFYKRFPENVCWQVPLEQALWQSPGFCKLRILNIGDSTARRDWQTQILIQSMNWSPGFQSRWSRTEVHETGGGGGRGGGVKLDPSQEVLDSSNGVAPFGLKPFCLSFEAVDGNAGAEGWEAGVGLVQGGNFASRQHSIHSV